MASDKISFRPRKTVQPPPKFVQITATSDDGTDVVFALDARGDVWQLVVDCKGGWLRLPTHREVE